MHGLRKKAGFLIIASALASPPAACAAEPAFGVRHLETLNAVRNQLTPLNLMASPHASDTRDAYFRRYRLDIAGVQHHFGTFESGDHQLAAHVFRPDNPQATVILLHGYLDHAGTLDHAIRALVQNDFAVAIYDQPGHGLSNGARAAINDFSDYVGIVRDFHAFMAEQHGAPIHVVAFSMGGAVAVDYLLNEEPDIANVVLIAPLVRSRHWHVSRLLNGIAALFVDAVPRSFRETSSDKDFLERLEADPLQPRRVPLSWFSALVRWNAHMKEAQPSTRVLKIIQGTDDRIVAWRFNLQFLKAKLPRAEVILIEGGRHHLFNESPVLRDAVLRHMLDHLSADT